MSDVPELNGIADVDAGRIGSVLADLSVRVARVEDRLHKLIARERDRNAKPSARPDKSDGA